MGPFKNIGNCMWHYQIKNAKGFFLPVMLLFMQLFILFVFYATQVTLLNTKSIGLKWKAEQFNNDLETILNVIEEDFMSQGSGCIIQPIPVETIQSASLNWWEMQSCTGNFHIIQYYYVIETLGEDPCAQIENAQFDVADYYRISLFGVDNQNGFKMLVQSSLVKPISVHDKCLLHRHPVQIGQQTWQKIGG